MSYGYSRSSSSSIYGPPCWSTPCPTCPLKYPAVGGCGPQPAPILVVGERPGKTENAHGRVLIGKTGEELDNTYLPLAGLRRSAVRTVNSVLCWSDNNRTPTEKEILGCAAHHLPQEVRDTRPEVIVLMGSSACKLLPKIRLEMMHGIPQRTSKVGELFGWSGWILPMYHPAMGLHDSKWMAVILEDWEALGRVGIDQWKEDPIQTDLDYKILVESEYSYLNNRSWPHPLSVDTEDHGGVPWSLQFSYWPDCGRLIRADDKQGLEWFRQWVTDKELTFHHAAHDLDVLDRMGIKVRRFRDTMQEAYGLCNLPQGLKSLAYRLFRVTMTSWEDVVRPASIDKLQQWLVEAWVVANRDLANQKIEYQKTCECGHSTKAHGIDPDATMFIGGGCKKCMCACYTPREKITPKPSTVESLLTRLIRLTDVSSDYDPWERLGEFWVADDNHRYVSHLETRIGKYPILGIANAPLSQAVRYGCGDSDMTGRVAVELERRRQTDRFEIYEGDRDQ